MEHEKPRPRHVGEFSHADGAVGLNLKGGSRQQFTESFFSFVPGFPVFSVGLGTRSGPLAPRMSRPQITPISGMAASRGRWGQFSASGRERNIFYPLVRQGLVKRGNWIRLRHEGRNSDVVETVPRRRVTIELGWADVLIIRTGEAAQDGISGR